MYENEDERYKAGNEAELAYRTLVQDAIGRALAWTTKNIPNIQDIKVYDSDPKKLPRIVISFVVGPGSFEEDE